MRIPLLLLIPNEKPFQEHNFSTHSTWLELKQVSTITISGNYSHVHVIITLILENRVDGLSLIAKMFL